MLVNQMLFVMEFGCTKPSMFNNPDYYYTIFSYLDKKYGFISQSKKKKTISILPFENCFEFKQFNNKISGGLKWTLGGAGFHKNCAKMLQKIAHRFRYVKLFDHSFYLLHHDFNQLTEYYQKN